MSKSKALRWMRYGYLGVVYFNRAKLMQIANDPEMSEETRHLANKIMSDLYALRTGLTKDLKAMDERNKKNA